MPLNMLKKCFSLTLITFTLITCKMNIQRADFTPRAFTHFYEHQDAYFSLSIPQNWEFVKQENALDSALKFSSENKKINGYLKQYVFRKEFFTLERAVSDYFIRRDKCSFGDPYMGVFGKTRFFLIKGIFREIYPIVTIVFSEGKYLYELTAIHNIDEADMEKPQYQTRFAERLLSAIYAIFTKMKFFSTEQQKFRKRFKVKFNCPPDWQFGLGSAQGEIASIGYKDRIIIVSLKAIRETHPQTLNILTEELKNIKFNFIKEMKTKKYRVIEREETLFGVKAQLVTVADIPTEPVRQGEPNTLGVVKKYLFIKNNFLFELLVIYSMQDMNTEVLKKINEAINGIQFE